MAGKPEKGQSYIVEVSTDGTTYSKVGFMRTKSLGRTRTTIETSSDDNPDHTSRISAMKDWSLSGESLRVFDDEGQQAIEEAYESDEAVSWRFTNNVTGADEWEGMGILTDATITANTNEVVTYRVAVEAAGPLTRSTIT